MLIKFLFSLLLATVFAFTFSNLITSHAQSNICGEIDVDGIQTKCFKSEDWTEKRDATEGGDVDHKMDSDYKEYGQTFKCLDTVTSCGAHQRCCVDPIEGHYGGQCKNPTLSRQGLGMGSESSFLDGLRPQNCDIRVDEPVGPGYSVVMEKVEGAFATQLSISAKTARVKENSNLDTSAKSQGGVVFETLIDAVHCVVPGPCKTIKEVWFYEIQDSGNKAYFYGTNSLNSSTDDLQVNLEYYARRDPRTGQGVTEKLGCEISNAGKAPFFKMVNTIGKAFTSADDYPDIALLCNKGAPLFTADNKGIIIDKDTNAVTFPNPEAQATCRCADMTTGPANASVLLCTKYVLGVGDNNPWRSVVPEQFVDLILGGAQESKNIQEMRAGVKAEVKEFFANKSKIEAWLKDVDTRSRTATFPEPFTIRTRLFGEKYTNTNEWHWDADTQRLMGGAVVLAPLDMAKIVNTIQSNYYAKEYISCLSCAKYGGFQSSLGCLPMDKVERFIAEGLLGIAISIAGAACMLGMIYGAIMYQLSMGDSTKIQKAKKIMTRFLSGLLVILFAIFILRFVGVDLLRIPGLS